MTTTNTKSLTADSVLNNILASKGGFVKVMWKSEPKPAAKFKGKNLEKITDAVCRAGIDYANLSPVKEGIASGERGEVEPLPWGEWYIDSTGKSMFPYLITHKDTMYVRLYPSTNKDQRPKSNFFVDGVKVDKQTFASYLTPSAAKKLLEPEDNPLCFTIKECNILGTEDMDAIASGPATGNSINSLIS